MARSYWSAASTGESTLASATFSDKVSLTLTAAQQAPSTNYWIIWSALVASNSTSTSVLARLRNKTANTTFHEYEVEDKDTTDYTFVGGVAKFTSAGTPADVEIAIQFAREGGSITVGIQEAHLVIIKAETGDQYAEAAGPSTTTSTSMQDALTLGWTPASSGDYLILAAAGHGGGIAGSPGYARAEVYDGSSELRLQDNLGDTADWYAFFTMLKGASLSGAQSWKIRFARGVNSSGSAAIRECALLAMRFDTFEAVQYAESLSESTTTSTSYQDKATLTFTPEAVDHLLIAASTIEPRSSVQSGLARILKGASPLHTEMAREGVDNSGQGAWFDHRHGGIQVEQLAASSTTWKTQWHSESTATIAFRDSAIAVLQLESAGSETQNLTPTLFTNQQSFPSPTVAPGAVGLVPSLMVDGDSFHSPTVSSIYALNASLYSNAQSYVEQTVGKITTVFKTSAIISAGAGTQNVAFSGAQEGDWVVVYTMSQTADVTVATSGYASPSGMPYIFNGYSRLSYKKMTATPDTSVDINQISGVDSGCLLWVLRGVDQTSIEDASVVTVSNNGTPNGSSIVTNVDGAWVLSVGFCYDTDKDPIAPTGYIEQVDNYNGWTRNIFGAWKPVSTAGTEDPGDWGGSMSANYDMLTWAVRPKVAVQDLQPSLVVNDQSFPTPVVSPGAVDLTPTLFTSSQTYFTQVVAALYALTPSPYTNTNTTYTQTVSPGAVNLLPSLYSNSNSFNSHTVTTLYDLQPTLFVNLFTDYTQTATVGAQNLDPSIHVNTNTFEQPTVAPGAVDLTPSLFSNNFQSYTHTVAVGAVNLAPSLFENLLTTYEQNVTSGLSISPDLFVNSQSFYTQQVTAGAVNLTASPYVNSQQTYTQQVTATYDVTAVLFTNTQSFYSQQVSATYSLTASLHTGTQSFYTQQVSATYNILLQLFTGAQQFYTQVLSTFYALVADLYQSASQFFVPQVTSTYTLAPALFTDSSQFFSIDVTFYNDLQPALFEATQSYYQHLLVNEGGLFPDLFANDQTFYAQTVVRQFAAAAPRDRRRIAATHALEATKETALKVSGTYTLEVPKRTTEL